MATVENTKDTHTSPPSVVKKAPTTRKYRLLRGLEYGFDEDGNRKTFNPEDPAANILTLTDKQAAGFNAGRLELLGEGVNVIGPAGDVVKAATNYPPSGGSGVAAVPAVDPNPQAAIAASKSAPVSRTGK